MAQPRRKPVVEPRGWTLAEVATFLGHGQNWLSPLRLAALGLSQFPQCDPLIERFDGDAVAAWLEQHGEIANAADSAELAMVFAIARREGHIDEPTGRRVYFIREGEAGPIKIGIGVSPLARMSGLQCGNPRRLFLITHMRGSRALEVAFHQFLDADRMDGEWFAPSRLVLALITEIAGRGA